MGCFRYCRGFDKIWSRQLVKEELITDCLNKGPPFNLGGPGGMLPQKIFKSGSSEMPFPAFWAPNHWVQKIKEGFWSTATFSFIFATLISSKWQSYWQNVRGVSVLESVQLRFLIFHPFVSFLFLRIHLRIACRSAREAAEAALRSISWNLQLRLISNE